MDTPLEIHWDREVWHPSKPGEDTVVCCSTADGQPVALFLNNELREALGLQLVDPNPDGQDVNDHDDMTNADVMSADEIAEYDRADEYAQDAADEARYAELADEDEASEEEPW